MDNECNRVRDECLRAFETSLPGMDYQYDDEYVNVRWLPDDGYHVLRAWIEVVSNDQTSLNMWRIGESLANTLILNRVEVLIVSLVFWSSRLERGLTASENRILNIDIDLGMFSTEHRLVNEISKSVISGEIPVVNSAARVY